jgi:uncharacterized membrane protein YhaH (DUF805 family)
MSWFVTALRQYAVFSGRSRRREYWYFALFYLVIYLLLLAADGVVGSFDPATGIGLLSGVFSLALLLPSLAVSVRRLHDTGRRGWWILLGLIPVAGVIVLIVFFAQDGEAGANRFGPSPKGGASIRPVPAASPGKPWPAAQVKR